jgi:hypothetical protein
VFAQQPAWLQAGHLRHVNVDEHTAGAVCSSVLEERRVLDRGQRDTRVGEQTAEQVKDHRFVVRRQQTLPAPAALQGLILSGPISSGRRPATPAIPWFRLPRVPP